MFVRDLRGSGFATAELRELRRAKEAADREAEAAKPKPAPKGKPAVKKNK
jgi:hypothetical protein